MYVVDIERVRLGLLVRDWGDGRVSVQRCCGGDLSRLLSAARMVGSICAPRVERIGGDGMGNDGLSKIEWPNNGSGVQNCSDGVDACLSKSSKLLEIDCSGREWSNECTKQ
jgi:hypothetical protein